MAKPTVGEMGKVMEQCTTDENVLADFYESQGEKEKAREFRVKYLEYQVNGQNYIAAIEHARAHKLLSFDEMQKLARTYCISQMYEHPWEALEIARDFQLRDLIKKAAVRYGEYILNFKEHDIAPALQIARNERADDIDFRRRTAKEAFKRYIRIKRPSMLLPLIEEFKEFFNVIEVGLAEILNKSTDEK